MMFRRAEARDIDAIAAIYDEIHSEEEAGRMRIGWDRAVYPTRATAEAALRAKDLYVAERDGRVIAAARINQEQVPEYANAAWAVDAPPDRVLVLHTLVVSPREAGRGCGSAFVRFYEECARQRGCPFLRMDTNEINAVARSLYRKLGYREADIVDCCFNGIPGVRLVCLEKEL